MTEFIEELKSETSTEAESNQILRGNMQAGYGADFTIGFLGWRPSPYDLEKNVPIDKRIVFRLKDRMSGIDINTVWVKVDGQKYQKGDPEFKYAGWRREYTISVRPESPWDYGKEVNVEVYAEDLAGNPGLAVEVL